MKTSGKPSPGRCMLLGLLTALAVVTLRIEQFVVGLAVNLLCSALTAYAFRTFLQVVPSERAYVTPLAPLRIPVLADLPLVGPALFQQTALTYLAYVLVPLVAFWLHRTHAGLQLRCLGENPKLVDMKVVLKCVSVSTEMSPDTPSDRSWASVRAVSMRALTSASRRSQCAKKPRPASVATRRRLSRRISSSSSAVSSFVSCRLSVALGMPLRASARVRLPDLRTSTNDSISLMSTIGSHLARPLRVGVPLVERRFP